MSARNDKSSTHQPLEVARALAGVPSLATATARAKQLLDLFASVRDTEVGVLLDVRRGSLRCLVIREPRTILSPRETEIARMVAQGHPTKRIAHTLEISGFTVNSHLRRIFMKLGVTSRPAMVAQLTQHGLVDLNGQEDDVIDGRGAWDVDDA